VATICEELPDGEPITYTAAERPRFATNCGWSIKRAREYWSQMFGLEQQPLSVADALRTFFSDEVVGAAAAIKPSVASDPAA
jgi:hypothetical protein